ncbi:MAG: hypothetical protein A2Y34_07685 [Spirochaetes bacterium GWC1_27_15]|nr:MAG: hypothetical protein A2Y34_07685 [Spirochaetes bacterium GWC1_27_15]
MLKLLKTLVSSILLVLFILCFLIINNFFDFLANVLTTMQFMPSFISLFNLKSFFTVLSFLFIITLTFLFGRIYCSFICPLGFLQDFFIKFTSLYKKNSYKYFNKINFLRYGILILLIIFFISGNLLITNLLDPYSIFGRIITDLIKPLIIWINNFFYESLNKSQIYLFIHIKLEKINLFVIFTTLIFFISILITSLLKGRLYCNSICPVGTLLGFISKISLFKINLNSETCTKCGLCEKKCVASCIDSKNNYIDQSLCVRCFNCLDVCKPKSLSFNILKPKPQFNLSRRHFISNSFNYLFAIFLTSFFPLKFLFGKSIPQKFNNKLIIPPGGLNIKHFSNNCTGCLLCVNKCPKKIIRANFLEHQALQIMQASINYSYGFCDYECNICSQVCPTNALIPLSLSEKKLTQIGIVQFIEKDCIVVKNQKDCGACSEHCPTKAVYMIPYKENLFIPATNTEICIGCGACEYACPAIPKAIIVNGNSEHKKAKIVKSNKNIEKVKNNDFPF